MDEFVTKPVNPDQLAETIARCLARPPAPRPVAAKAAPAAPPKARAKLRYKDQRDLDLLPAEIEKLGAAIARDEAALAEPDLYTRDPRKFDRLMKAIEKTRADRDAAEMRWLGLAEMAENLTG
jgi:ATP-binding cassette subfamily F protein uup